MPALRNGLRCKRSGLRCDNVPTIFKKFGNKESIPDRGHLSLRVVVLVAAVLVVVLVVLLVVLPVVRLLVVLIFPKI